MTDPAGAASVRPPALVPEAGPGFDRPVPPGGYAWWYVDALSDDGRHGLTLIGFVGSVFSPYYFAARRRGGGIADPENHVALNVALYGASGHRWAMTERGNAALSRDAARLAIGPSAMTFDGRGLTVAIDEIAVPWPRRIAGTVRLMPDATGDFVAALDPKSRHRWHPIAPHARVEVALASPRLSWAGIGYFDSNRGDEPLEAGFRAWTWARAADGDGALVVYDMAFRGGGTSALALRFDGRGRAEPFEPPATMALPRARVWRMPRAMRSDAGMPPRALATFEDTPFYARSLVAARLAGRDATAFHESLDLDRFASGWVQRLLPFRMPRRAGLRR